MTHREFQERLARRARRAGVSMTPILGARLEQYFRLLTTWNQRINLTGLDLDELKPEALDRLLIEPLVAARYVAAAAARMIDIGSGGGSPAIPLALALPRLTVALVESKTRKSVFLREVVRALSIPDVEVVTSRFEALLSRPSFHEAHDLLTIRAVRIESRVLMSVQAFVKPGGQLFLFRGSAGPDPAEEMTPPLAWHATYPLIESLRSRLIVVDKRSKGRDVPRGTPA